MSRFLASMRVIMKKSLLLTSLLIACSSLSIAQTGRVAVRNSQPRTSLVTIRATPLAVTGSSYASLTTAWSYNPNAPACPATGTLTNCYNGFNVSLAQGATVVFTKSAGQSSGQLGPTASSAVWTPAGGVPYGTYTVTVTVAGFDVNGTPITSTPVTATFTVGVTFLNPPTGVTLTAN